MPAIISDSPLTNDQANAIYDVLVDFAGAREDSREDFVYSQINRFISEYRFMGGLGFGGKFWRTDGRRQNGSWGETWRVSLYREDETIDRLNMYHDTNRALTEIANKMLPN